MTTKITLMAAAGAVALAACSANAPQKTAAAAANTAVPGRVEVCKATNEAEIASLFDRWNASLKTGNPKRVVENYANNSILLPTVSNTPRISAAEKEDYFTHFLQKAPAGKIDMRHIQLDCNKAIDAGLYTFTFGKTGESVRGRYTFTYRWNGSQWLISSHHSSVMPEQKAASVH